MTDKVVELRGVLARDKTSEWIGNTWDIWDNQREVRKQQWSEVQSFVFATDTTTTSVNRLPWTHTTTIPKLTQIRDNLHSNYISSLFPNDKWLQWLAYDKKAASREKAGTITAYMENKTREGKFRDVVSRWLYDYIDYGDAFSMASFESRYNTINGQKTAAFIGPKAVRISPLDIVFDPTATEFAGSPKIIRSVKTLGELKKMSETHPDHKFWEKALERRQHFKQLLGSYSKEDFEKAAQYQIDGFGDLWSYYQSNYVEILEFYGDYHSETGELFTNRMITVVDRSVVVRDEPINTYSGQANIRKVGWRLRPDNLWSMGPLDNILGLQYKLDHMENMKANALDLMVLSPKKIIGEVEEFEWGPLAEIHIDENGDVQELAQGFNNIFAASNEMQEIEGRMELYAGAPREAMGVRTPGEKTAFEVQALENAAGRIFQEKIIQFELFLEEVLNDMLEESHRNMDMGDLIRIVDNDLGVQQFKNITKEDITANGILRPVGARHFAQRAQELQNIVGIFSSPIADKVAPHTSGIALTEFISDVVDLRGYDIFKPNIAVSEAQETQAIAQQAEEDNIMEQQAGNSEEELLSTIPLGEEGPSEETQNPPL